MKLVIVRNVVKDEPIELMFKDYIYTVSIKGNRYSNIGMKSRRSYVEKQETYELSVENNVDLVAGDYIKFNNESAKIVKVSEKTFDVETGEFTVNIQLANKYMELEEDELDKAMKIFDKYNKVAGKLKEKKKAYNSKWYNFRKVK